MNVRITTLPIAFLVLLFVVNESCAATIGYQGKEIADSKLERPLARQSPEVSSTEDSDEDDEEDDAEQFQQNSQQQQLQAQDESVEESEEDGVDDDDDDDDESFSFLGRRRRDAVVAEVPADVVLSEKDKQSEKPQAQKQPVASENESETESLATEGTTATTAAPSRKSSVLVLIRDALKKVTTELPTEQVATNALQYFQLFEHFIQQTIEQVIGGDDDDDEPTIAITSELESPSAITDADANKNSVTELLNETNATAAEQPESMPPKPIVEKEKRGAAAATVESVVENAV
jgi:hypothetical protein